MDDRSGFLVVILVIAVVIVGSVSFLSLYGTKKNSENIQVRKEQDMKFEKLANLKVFFGHQSVGENIVQGMKEILSEHSGISFKIVEAKDLSSILEGTFVHAIIGRNTRPESKIRAFEKILTSAPPGSIDIALMKFCYVDLNRDSDPEALFETYSTRIAALGAKLPGTTFVHTTVPIESAPQGAKNFVKGWAKAVLRRPGVAEDNRVRERFNSLIRETFGGTEPIFDIASAESVGPDGRRSYRVVGSQAVFLMDPRYTSDGGHLNRLGRVRVAEQLLFTLADAADRMEDE